MGTMSQWTKAMGPMGQGPWAWARMLIPITPVSFAKLLNESGAWEIFRFGPFRSDPFRFNGRPFLKTECGKAGQFSISD